MRSTATAVGKFHIHLQFKYIYVLWGGHFVSTESNNGINYEGEECHLLQTHTQRPKRVIECTHLKRRVRETYHPVLGVVHE